MVAIPEVHRAKVYEPGVFFDAETGGPLQLELGRIGPKSFRVRRQFGYRDASYDAPFICPHDVGDFETDLASIPFFFSWIVPSRGTHFPAIMLHDALVVGADEDPTHLGPAVDREEADRIMRDAMERLGVGFVRRWLAWTGAFLATAAGSLEPRKRWLTLVVLHFGIIGILGLVATLDLFDVWDVLPWMGDRGTVAELVGGTAGAIVVPPVLAILWWRRWLAPTVGGILLAFVLHITLAMLILYGVYRAGERLFAGRTRGADEVAGESAALVLDEQITAQFGKGSATFSDLKLPRSRLRVTVTGPQMLVSSLRLVTDLGILEGHDFPSLQRLADNLEATAICGKGEPVTTEVSVQVDRQGPSLHIDVGPMSMYESVIEIRTIDPEGGANPPTLEELLNDTIGSGTGRGYLAGLIPLAPVGHREADDAGDDGETETMSADAAPGREVGDATDEELWHGNP